MDYWIDGLMDPPSSDFGAASWWGGRVRGWGLWTLNLLRALIAAERRKLSHCRLMTRTSTAELERPSCVGSGDLLVVVFICQSNRSE